METKKEREGMRDSALMLLRDLEFISRRLCEGYVIDLSHAERVIGLLANFPELGPFQNDLEGVVSSTVASGIGGGSEKATGSMEPLCAHRLQWVRQMSRALTKIKLENEDLDCRVSFVNAAIEWMNCLRRHMKEELEILYSSTPKRRSPRLQAKQSLIC